MPYLPAWNSLRRHTLPEWFRDAKFGIYTHWGIYSVPACGPNATWYPYNMYIPGTPQHAHHVATYGGPQRFGYKDFIPDFTGERFDPDAWAVSFRAAGAKFAGPVAEHHDGFAMWDTRYSEWNSACMGPRRDVVGSLATAIRRQGMKYFTAFHHAENWWFYPHWEKAYDTFDPRYAGLYGALHDVDGLNGKKEWSDQALPTHEFLQVWRDKILEVIDKYGPDIIWFDFGLWNIAESYVRDFLSYYYNKAEEWGREVVVTYKYHHLPPNVALVDLELGREGDLTYHEWITDSTVDEGEGWGYVRDIGFKSTTALIHYLVDNVSRNGYLLLNVGPRADGTIPDEAQERLLGMGKWLDINGEAIYGTTPWMIAGEGDVRIEKPGPFNEQQSLHYSARDIRFTCKDDFLYATCLGWPENSVTITTLKGWRCYPNEVKAVSMLGSDEPLRWQTTDDGLLVYPPARKPCEHAFVLKIQRDRPY